MFPRLEYLQFIFLFSNDYSSYLSVSQNSGKSGVFDVTLSPEALQPFRCYRHRLLGGVHLRHWHHQAKQEGVTIPNLSAVVKSELNKGEHIIGVGLLVNSGGKCLSTFAARSRNSAVHPRVSVSILDRVWRWSGCSFNLRPRIARNVAISFLCFLLIFYTKSHPPLGVVPGKQHHLSHGGHAARHVVHPGDGEHGRDGRYSSPGI